MDRKLIIAGAVAAVLALGGLAYAVSQQGPGSAPAESAPIPASQLQNEMPRGEDGGTRIVPKMPDGKPLPM